VYERDGIGGFGGWAAQLALAARAALTGNRDKRLNLRAGQERDKRNICNIRELIGVFL
jgi:hypothetical protein